MADIFSLLGPILSYRANQSELANSRANDMWRNAALMEQANVDRYRIKEGGRQYDTGIGLDRSKFAETGRQFDVGSELDRSRLAETGRQFDVGSGLDRSRLAETGRQFDVGSNEAKRQFDILQLLSGRNQIEAAREAALNAALGQSAASMASMRNGISQQPSSILDPDSVWKEYASKMARQPGMGLQEQRNWEFLGSNPFTISKLARS